ncbi:nuclear transport factor 2 family protein [Streptomyces sp. NPDC005492]|uniref:nuclear transport factor 2 family protein n=1 Tax=Streptomyces sp. NPDC005492 TaxID=3156883 RepID=UPI0033BBAE20
MTDTVIDTVIDRYIALADEAVHDESALAELLALFAPDATVRLGSDPVHGHEAVTAFYRAHFDSFADTKHYWNTTVLDDGTLRAEWVCAARTADDQLMTVAGVEHATLDGDGLITDLRNEFTQRP